MSFTENRVVEELVSIFCILYSSTCSCVSVCVHYIYESVCMMKGE